MHRDLNVAAIHMDPDELFELLSSGQNSETVQVGFNPLHICRVYSIFKSWLFSGSEKVEQS